jgi:predicted dehydrogenase
MDKVRVGVVGLGKMGLSHHSLINAHPDVTLAGVCDSSGYILDVLQKYTGVATFSRFSDMLERAELDALIVATPSRLHAEIVRAAMDRGLHVFCEKPFCLNPSDSVELAGLAKENRLVTQVGYHCRFIAAFEEVKRLLDAGAIGEVTHVLAETYGPVVLQPKRATWRAQREEGGGCLYDYAAHPINLLNWYFGEAKESRGARLNSVFSENIDDQVLGTLIFEAGKTAQLCVDWSDESCRKMTVKMTLWGTRGRIYADRQECQVYLRDGATVPQGYQHGWNVRYTTDLTKPVWFYVRGEEYSSQLDYFVNCVREQATENVNSFAEAALTDKTIAMMVADAQSAAGSASSGGVRPVDSKRRRSLFGLSRLRPFSR